ncbi:MAG: hypothetical protein M3R35_01525 [Candidatus Eremiobacteraeota bacterium]|nr:hypothetical protein [Candidatus Eremiobacteraeota bacterium]
MRSRKDFIAAAASVGAFFAAAPVAAQSKAAPVPSPTPKPKEPPKISEVARAFANQMREYDATLTDKQIQDIAEGMDYNLGLGKRINPKGKALENGDEPIVIFEVNA